MSRPIALRWTCPVTSPSAVFSRTAAPALAVVLLLSGCALDDEKAAPDGKADSSGAAATALAELEVKSAADRAGYDRRKFGSPWADTDGNSCSTRNDILQRDLDEVRLEEDECVVGSGILKVDPYTGEKVEFTKGRSKVDIDHLVALSDAWEKGAGEWDPAKRIALANDPLNLLAVDASANRQKGDADAADWLPANDSYRCEYVALQIAVKAKYELWVTPKEKNAMSDVLEKCSDQPLPSLGDEPTGAPDRFSAPE